LTRRAEAESIGFMRTIVLRQPWASLVLEGKKTIELRTWQTKHRGPVLIVVGKGIDHSDAKKHGWRDGPRGVALCIVDLDNVRPATLDDEQSAGCVPDASREFAWCISNPRPVRQIPMLGRLGLYDVETTEEELSL
jgi:hypothetical protein